MAAYIVTRSGSSNTHNEIGVCGTVEASGEQDARHAAYEKCTTYSGQVLSVKLWTRSSQRDRNRASDVERERQEEEAFYAELQDYFAN
jgi:hypothetical protein